MIQWSRFDWIPDIGFPAGGLLSMGESQKAAVSQNRNE